jgi:predicted N-acyltransferase
MTATECRVQTRDSGRQAISLTAKSVEGLQSIPAAEWDALLTPASGALCHDYLIAWEKSELTGLRSCPTIAYAEGGAQPVAACPGYFYELDILGVRFPAMASVLETVRKLWPKLLYARTYELGSPTPLTNPFLTADPGLRPMAVKALIGAALEEGDRSDAQFVLVQNFTSRNGPAGEQLRELGFVAVPMLPTAVVDLRYDSFEDYLGSMRAQYRRRARQALKRSQDLTVEHRDSFAELADELAHLWRLIYQRAGEVKREILTPEFFRAASDVESTSVVLTRRADGSIASFALLLADRPYLTFLHTGFDESAGRSEGAYFRLLYEIVRLGIEGGYEQVELGMTTLEPKLDVGAIPVPLFAWLKHSNPLIQRSLSVLANRLMTPDGFEPRRVFKEPPSDAGELVARRGLLV